MNPPAAAARQSVRKYVESLVAVTVALLCLAVVSDNPLSYIIVLLASILPITIWLYLGAKGIPIFPAVSALYFVYYGLPILRKVEGHYSSEEIEQGAVTIACFLLLGWLAWFLVSVRTKIVKPRGPDTVSPAQIQSLVAIGLSAGIFYHVTLSVGWLSDLGGFLGVLRSVTLTFAAAACYLFGYARAHDIIRGKLSVIFLVAMAALVMSALASLFLVSGVMYIAAALLGYILAKKRIPWLVIATLFILATVLHSGKETMRHNNWLAGSQSNIANTVIGMPSLMADWFGAGLSDLIAGRKSEDALVERTSLLHMLLLVQRATPEAIPHLKGETYSFLSSTLMPRFLVSEKASSQSGLNLLSIRYGLQSEDATHSTTLAWGIPAEAFANFGYYGIVVAALLLGALCAIFTRLSVGTSPISFSMLVAISATINLLNVEADFGYLLLNILQSVVAVMLFFLPLKLFRGNTSSLRRQSALRRAPLYRTRAGQAGDR